MPIVRVPGGMYQELRDSAATSVERVILRQFVNYGVWDDYEFPFAPVDVQYEDIANEIVEIARAGQYAHIDQRAPRLMKVSFDVRIADRLSGGLRPIDDDLIKLRTMATRNTVSRLEGMDSLLSYRSNLPPGRVESAWYRITGFTVRSVRREIVPGTGHAISVADCGFQFTEQRNNYATFVPLPRLIYPVEIPQTGGGGDAPIVDLGVARDTYTGAAARLRQQMGLTT